MSLKYNYPLKYSGKKYLLIIFLFFWPPLVIPLLIRNSRFIKNDSIFYLSYEGKYEWLFFWSIFFFPIAIALLLINGMNVNEENIE